jgi:hypothetical protein
MWRCPKCGAKIRIFEVRAAIVVHDDGVEQDSDFEWDDDSSAECTACAWEGIAGESFIEEIA